MVDYLDLFFEYCELVGLDGQLIYLECVDEDLQDWYDVVQGFFCYVVQGLQWWYLLDEDCQCS